MRTGERANAGTLLAAGTARSDGCRDSSCRKTKCKQKPNSKAIKDQTNRKLFEHPDAELCATTQGMSDAATSRSLPRPSRMNNSFGASSKANNAAKGSQTTRIPSMLARWFEVCLPFVKSIPCTTLVFAQAFDRTHFDSIRFNQKR